MNVVQSSILIIATTTDILQEIVHIWQQKIHLKDSNHVKNHVNEIKNVKKELRNFHITINDKQKQVSTFTAENQILKALMEVYYSNDREEVNGY